MKNLIQHTTDFAMSIARAYIKDNSLVIDATCGNGHDTLALADDIFSCATQTQLVAFDIQKAAIDNTKARLTEAGFGPQIDRGDITLIQSSHASMPAHLSEDAKACLIVFNLGYLPGGDKSITTDAETTLRAVQNALNLLDVNGLVCITMYSGHAAGAKEKQALLAFAEELDSHVFHVSYISMINQPGEPPEILLISRKG